MLYVNIEIFIDNSVENKVKYSIKFLSLNQTTFALKYFLIIVEEAIFTCYMKHKNG